MSGWQDPYEGDDLLDDPVMEQVNAEAEAEELDMDRVYEAVNDPNWYHHPHEPVGDVRPLRGRPRGD